MYDHDDIYEPPPGVDGPEYSPESEVIAPPSTQEADSNLLEIEVSNRVRIFSSEHHDGQFKQFILTKNGHDGLISPPSELAYLDHAILEGGSIAGARAQKRRITLDFVARGISHQDVSRLFPLGKREQIRVTRNGTTRVIDAYRDGPINIEAHSSKATPVVSVSFLCPNPYFRNEVEVRSPLSGVTGGLTYPVTYPLRYGEVGENAAARILNLGDYPAPFVLTLTTNVGGTLGIVIDGVEQARIVGVASGEQVTFDTGAKILTINGVKRLSALDGTFPRLPVRSSEVSLTGLAGNPIIRFNEIFEGV